MKYIKSFNENIDNNLPSIDEIRDYFQALTDDINIEPQISVYRENYGYNKAMPIDGYRFIYVFEKTINLENYKEIMSNITMTITDDYMDMNVLFFLSEEKRFIIDILNTKRYNRKIDTYYADVYVYNKEENKFTLLTN